MIRVDGEKNNVEMDGDLLTISSELSLVVHDLSMIEHIPDEVIISAIAIGLSHKGSGDTSIYKGIIRKAVDIIANGIEEVGD